MKLRVLCLLAIAGTAHAQMSEDDRRMIVDNIRPDFESPMGTAADPKHHPILTAPEAVDAGAWFPVTIEIGAGALHPSLVEHHVRWISLEADGVEINRTYLHPTLSKPTVTWMIALPDARTFGSDGTVIARADRSVTLRAVEAPTHASQFWAETTVLVRAITP